MDPTSLPMASSHMYPVSELCGKVFIMVACEIHTQQKNLELILQERGQTQK